MNDSRRMVRVWWIERKSNAHIQSDAGIYEARLICRVYTVADRALAFYALKCMEKYRATNDIGATARQVNFTTSRGKSSKRLRFADIEWT